MTGIFLTTLQKVCVTLLYAAAGYWLRRSSKVPENSGRVLSVLTTTLFCPAYNIKNLSQSVTLANLAQKSTLVLYGLVCLLLIVGLAFILARKLGRSEMERSSLTYAFIFPNYGYFGYPLIESVFGQAVLSDVMLFAVPMAVATGSFGYVLFMKGGKLTWKQVLGTPMVLAIIIGCGVGVSGIQLPSLVTDVLTGAGSCMSPASMLLAGFVLGGFPLRKLLSGIRSYLISGIRLLGIPLLIAGILLLLGVRGQWFLLPLLLFSLPLGLNLVVFPESLGYDASDNARMCFVSYLLALIVLPVTYAILSQFMV